MKDQSKTANKVADFFNIVKIDKNVTKTEPINWSHHSRENNESYNQINSYDL